MGLRRAVRLGCHGEDPVVGGRMSLFFGHVVRQHNQQTDHLANKAMDGPEEGTEFVPERLLEERGLSAAPN